MTVTRAEFERLLPGAVGEPWRREADGFSGGSGTRKWRVRLATLEPLRAGPLALERLEVRLAFQGYAREERETFLARFMAGFQRGGG